MKKSILLTAALGALALVPLAQAATAPPDARLRASTGSAPLHPWTYTWTHQLEQSEPGAPQCATVVADGIPGYGIKIRTRHAKATPMVVISGARKPDVRRFRAYPRLDDERRTAGRGRRVVRDLHPLGGDFDKPAAWGIAFKVNLKKARYFDLHLGFRNPDQTACAEGGDAWYSFGIGKQKRRR